jgi:putative transcriptional regulator
VHLRTTPTSDACLERIGRKNKLPETEPEGTRPPVVCVNLDLMLIKKRLTLSELAERVGITLANLSILKTNKARAIRFSTLAALCRELECQPGDLLEYRNRLG